MRSNDKGIAVGFANHFPHKIKSLSLIAPAGLLERLPFIAYILQAPLVGPVVWYGLGRRVLQMISESSFQKTTDAVAHAKLLTAEHIRIRIYYILTDRSWIFTCILLNSSVFSTLQYGQGIFKTGKATS